MASLVARLPLIPKDSQFFVLFDEAGANMRQASELLNDLMQRWPESDGLGREILICEQEGDRITHDIIQRLNSKTLAPIDRHDIHELASAVDDVVDFIEEAADFLTLYGVEAPMDQAPSLSSVLRDACREVAQALTELRRFKGLETISAR